MKLRVSKDFSIAFKGLKLGTHHFEYQIDDKFFHDFETSPVKTGNIYVDLLFIKRLDHIELDFEVDGTIGSNCDRCTANIELPIFKQGKYIIKFSDEEIDDPEVIYIHTNTQLLNVSEMIYELVVLGIPLIKVFDCEEIEPLPCNESVLKYLSKDQEPPKSQNQENPIWDKLNEINFEEN